MHCMLLRAATLMLVDRQRTTAWQSAPRREVSTPTSALSKKATSRLTIALNSSALTCAGPPHSLFLACRHLSWQGRAGEQGCGPAAVACMAWGSCNAANLPALRCLGLQVTYHRGSPYCSPAMHRGRMSLRRLEHNTGQGPLAAACLRACMSSVLSRLKKKPRSPAQMPYDIETACTSVAQMPAAAKQPYIS